MNEATSANLAKAKEMVKANSGEPAPSEKVNGPAEWLPIESAPLGQNIILAFRNDAGKWRRVIGWYAQQFEIEVDADEIHPGLEEGPAGEAIYAKPGWYEYLDADEAPCNRIRPEFWHPLPAPPGAQVTISNEAERDTVSLNQPSLTAALKAENERLREAMVVAIAIIKTNLYHQREKVEDAVAIISAALSDGDGR